MNSREIAEINAGSMADIAFLLLVFFLVTTTLEKDEGIQSVLPPKLDNRKPFVLTERNVFRVSINANNELLVEKEPVTDMKALEEMAIEFYTNPNNSDNLPVTYMVNAQLCKEKMAAFSDTSIAINKAQYLQWKRKLTALPLLGGSFRELNPKAVIMLTHDNNTTYEKYIQIRDALAAALNHLRNKYAKEKFGKYYTEMNIRNMDDKEKMQAIQLVFPQRLSEAKPRNVNIN